MRTEQEIINRIIETSRKIALVQNKKDNFCTIPIENTEKAIKKYEQAIKKYEQELLDLDFKINSLGTELNILSWLFGKEID